MKEVIERAIDTLTGADPLSLYRKDQAEIEQIEAQLEALNQKHSAAGQRAEHDGNKRDSKWFRVGGIQARKRRSTTGRATMAPPEELGRPPLPGRAGVPRIRPGAQAGLADYRNRRKPALLLGTRIACAAVPRQDRRADW